MRVFVKREYHSVPRICRHATDANIPSHPPTAIRMYANVCLYECVIVRVCMMRSFHARAGVQAVGSGRRSRWRADSLRANAPVSGLHGTQYCRYCRTHTCAKL